MKPPNAKMKVKPRATHERVAAKRITAPETRLDKKTNKNIVLLSYIDAGSYQRHCPTTKELFLYSAGTNEVGEIPDGLDRLLHHQYIIHKDSRGKAIGLDIIPNRLYRSGVVPRSQSEVNTLIIQFDLDGAVARVTQRPFNIRFEHSSAIIRELDKLIASGKTITTSVRLGNLGRVVNTTDNSVEIKINASAAGRNNPAAPEADVDNIHELDEVPTARSAASSPA